MKATRVHCGPELIQPVYTRVPEDEEFLSFFSKNFKINIVSETEEEIVFDMVGVDAPIANALRRILLAEVPTVALEHIFIYKNTSIIQDEVLAHRLGLIPLKVDPRLVHMMNPGDDPTDLNTIVYRLTATGQPQSRTASETAALETENDAEHRYTKVYSSALQWNPEGTQEERFGSRGAGPVHDDILIAKLAPGQTIEIEAHAVKSIGKDHAKFSPVATASYRLLPHITIAEDKAFYDAEADALVARCPMGVYDIEDIGAAVSSSRRGSSSAPAGVKRKAVVARPRDCTVCRECIRDPEWNERIKIEKITDHFIFSIESTGALPARTLFQEAIRVLIEKCERVKAGLEEALTRDDGGLLPAAQAARVTIAAMTTETDDLTA